MTDGETGDSSRAVVCDSCSRLISLADSACPYCGSLRTGASASLAVRSWLRGRSLSSLFLATNIALYIVSLVLTGKAALEGGQSFLDFLGPSGLALDFLGACRPDAVILGQEYWRLLTAAFLHVGIVHILFNGMAIRSLGHMVEDFFGTLRFAIVYLGSAIIGNLTIVLAGEPAVGASGAIFGLLGAGLAFGFRRGGTFGQMIRGEFGRWVLYNVIFTFAVPGISVAGHFGGLGGGFVLGWLLTPPQRRSAAESAAPPWLTLLAALLLILVPVSFGASVVNGLFFQKGGAARLFGGNPGTYALRNQILTPRALNDLGLTNWVVGVPPDWKTVYRSPEAFQLVGNLGVSLTVYRVNATEGADSRDVLRQASGTAPWDMDAASLEAGAESAGADFVPRKDAEGIQGARRRLFVRRTESRQWIAIVSEVLENVDVAAWRGFFARVVESIRKA